MAITITKGNRGDITVAESLDINLIGQMYADKGYISKDLFQKLHSKGLKLFTNIPKDMNGSVA